MLEQPKEVGKLLGLGEPLFLADADIPAREIWRLRGLYGVASIRENGASEWPDEKVLKIARIQDRVLITCDRDFGRLVFESRVVCRGVVYLRRQPRNIADRVFWYVGLCQQRGTDMRQHFAALDRDCLRLRRLPTVAQPSRVATLTQRESRGISHSTRIPIPKRLWPT
jgi:hypothetical protein